MTFHHVIVILICEGACDLSAVAVLQQCYAWFLLMNNLLSLWFLSCSEFNSGFPSFGSVCCDLCSLSFGGQPEKDSCESTAQSPPTGPQQMCSDLPDGGPRLAYCLVFIGNVWHILRYCTKKLLLADCWEPLHCPSLDLSHRLQ
jgi:hypothetical protein